MLETYKIHYEVNEKLKARARTLDYSTYLINSGINESDKYKIYISLLNAYEVAHNLYLDLSKVKNIENHLHYEELMGKAKELRNVETLPTDTLFDDYQEKDYEDYKGRLKTVGSYLETLLGIDAKMKGN